MGNARMYGIGWFVLAYRMSCSVCSFCIVFESIYLDEVGTNMHGCLVQHGAESHVLLGSTYYVGQAFFLISGAGGVCV
jgi:hypothetical protein